VFQWSPLAVHAPVLGLYLIGSMGTCTCTCDLGSSGYLI